MHECSFCINILCFMDKTNQIAEVGEANTTGEQRADILCYVHMAQIHEAPLRFHSRSFSNYSIICGFLVPHLVGSLFLKPIRLWQHASEQFKTPRKYLYWIRSSLMTSDPPANRKQKLPSSKIDKIVVWYNLRRSCGCVVLQVPEIVPWRWIICWHFRFRNKSIPRIFKWHRMSFGLP